MGCVSAWPETQFLDPMYSLLLRYLRRVMRLLCVCVHCCAYVCPRGSSTVCYRLSFISGRPEPFRLGPHGVKPGVGLPGCLKRQPSSRADTRSTQVWYPYARQRGVMPLYEFARCVVVQFDYCLQYAYSRVSW